MKQVDLTKYDKEDLANLAQLVSSIQKEVGLSLKHQSASDKPKTKNDNISATRPSAPSYTAVDPGQAADCVFIDDKLTPGDVIDTIGLPENEAWAILRSYAEFDEYLKKHGIPKFISFDFNLEHEKNGQDCAKLLVAYCLEHNIDKLPNYAGHGTLQTHKQAIEQYLMPWGKYKRLYRGKQAKAKL